MRSPSRRNPPDGCSRQLSHGARHPGPGVRADTDRRDALSRLQRAKLRPPFTPDKRHGF
jgi:hypothetical protein